MVLCVCVCICVCDLCSTHKSCRAGARRRASSLAGVALIGAHFSSEQDGGETKRRGSSLFFRPRSETKSSLGEILNAAVDFLPSRTRSRSINRNRTESKSSTVAMDGRHRGINASASDGIPLHSHSPTHHRKNSRGSYKLVNALLSEDECDTISLTDVAALKTDSTASQAREYAKRRPSQIQIPSSPTPSRPRKLTIDGESAYQSTQRSQQQQQQQRRKLTIDGRERRASIERRGSLGLLTRR